LAQPVVDAEIKFGEACLDQKIPQEMNADLVKRGVGMLIYDDKVFCTALRIGNDQLLTAKHCFVHADTGEATPPLAGIMHNKGNIWFVYESEPNDRFEVCRQTVPKASGWFSPDLDNVTVKISKPHTDAPPVTRATLPIHNGASLYLRAYFPFVAGNHTVLEQMRSTGAGACFAHAATDRCFFHVCQSTPIMSGAPIFIRPDAKAKPTELVLAGVHIGSAGLVDPTTASGTVCGGISGKELESSNFGYQP
jgi:hypothetical protein